MKFHPQPKEMGSPHLHAQDHARQSSQQTVLAALGTWTKRMTFFTAKQEQPHDADRVQANGTTSSPKTMQQLQNSPSKHHEAERHSLDSWKSCRSGSCHSLPRQLPPASAPVPTRAQAEHPQQSLTSEDDEDQTQAAWRWRFNRRWAREQARQFQPQPELDDEDDSNWDDVLGYMDACGRPGWQLQIARTGSTDGLLSQSSEPSALLLEGSLPEVLPGPCMWLLCAQTHAHPPQDLARLCLHLI